MRGHTVEMGLPPKWSAEIMAAGKELIPRVDVSDEVEELLGRAKSKSGPDSDRWQCGLL